METQGETAILGVPKTKRCKTKELTPAIWLSGTRDPHWPENSWKGKQVFVGTLLGVSTIRGRAP